MLFRSNAVREFQAAVDLDPSNGEYRTCLALATDLRARDPLEQETGWLIVFAETGLAPFKVRHNPVVTLPRFVRARSRYSGAMVSTRASGSELAYAGTLDIEALACRWLHERAGAYLAREVGHAVAREVLADQVGKVFKSKEAREITRVVMMLARQPDTRSWRTIPQQISVYAARLPDHEGELAYAVRSSYGGERADKVHFAVKKARITTVLLRALN